MPNEGMGNASNGIAFLVSAGIMYEVIAASCSSPQTTEINAGARAGTLMKWVGIGIGTGAIFVAIAAIYDRGHAVPILAGGILAGGMMYIQYDHAKKAGLASPQPGTETYGQ